MLKNQRFQEGETIHIKGLKCSEKEYEKRTRVKKIRPRKGTVLTRAGVIAKAKADEKKRLEKEMETWLKERKLEENRKRWSKDRKFYESFPKLLGAGGGSGPYVVF